MSRSRRGHRPSAVSAPSPARALPMSVLKRLAAPLLALLLAAPLAAQEANRNVRFGLPSQSVASMANLFQSNARSCSSTCGSTGRARSSWNHTTFRKE